MSGNKKYWVMAVGKDSFLWDYCRKGNFVSLGWTNLADLSSVPSLEELKKIFLEKQWGNRYQAGTNCSTIWNFVKVMKVGDIILIRKGQKKILGVGEVVSDYYVDSSKIPPRTEYEKIDDGDYSGIRDVKWLEGFPAEGIDIDGNKSWLRAVMELNKEDFDSLLDQLKRNKKSAMLSRDSEIQLVLKKKQIILYGPPGTGKTFGTKELAIKIVGDN